MRVSFQALILLSVSGATAFTNLPKASWTKKGAVPLIKEKDTLSRSFSLSAASLDKLDDSGSKIFQPFLSQPRFQIKKSNEVVIDPDYKLAWMFCLAGLAISLFYPDKSCFDVTATKICPPQLFPGISAFLHIWFGIFLADRASRIRCVFDNKYFQMKNVYEDIEKSGGVMQKLDESKMTDRTKNYVVGGANKWAYEKFVNYDFFPSVHLPILVYFKENQTPSTKWMVGPGKYDRVGGGMVHFFPAFGNSYQLKKEFEARGCGKK